MQARTFAARDDHGQDFFLAHERLSGIRTMVNTKLRARQWRAGKRKKARNSA
jgi:hypothetical protein